MLFLIYDLNPPGCGALFLRRATAGACKKQTAAPAPLRLNLPQAAAQLRSPPPAAVPLRPAAAPPCGGARLLAGVPSSFWLCRRFQAQAGAAAAQPAPRRSSLWFIPPEGGMPRSGRGDTLKGWGEGIDHNIKSSAFAFSAVRAAGPVRRCAGPEGEGGCFESPSLPPLDSLPSRNDQRKPLDSQEEVATIKDLKNASSACPCKPQTI